jgi:hypothetical protein
VIEYVVREHADGWAVVALAKGVAENTVVAVYPHASIATKEMQRRNAEQMGRAESVVVHADDHKRGCTCGRGVMLPGEPLCPIHYP